MKRNVHLIPFAAVAASVFLWHFSEPLMKAWEDHATTLWSWLTIQDKPSSLEDCWLDI